MNPATLVPPPESIPVAPGWFQFLLHATFIVHLLFMNTVLGWALIAFSRELKGGAAALPTSEGLRHGIATKIPTMQALTINFGVAPLLFMQVLYGSFFYSSSVIMAWWWLAVVGLVLAAYCSLYWYDFRFSQLSGRRVAVIGFAALMLLGTSFMFSNNMTLMLVPERWTVYFDAPGGTFLNITEPTLFPRWLHFVFASAAVGGLALAIVWQRRLSGSKAADPDFRQRAQENVQTGLRWFIRGTVAQMAAGVWLLIALPGDIMQMFLGGSAAHTGHLLLGIAGACLSLYFALRGRVGATVGGAVFTVAVMSLTRGQLRAAYLAPYFRVEEMPVTPQYGPMALFGVSLLLGGALVVWMLNAARKAGGEG